LRDAVARINPDLPAAAVEEAVRRFARPDGVDTIRRNKAFHEMLTHGIEIQVDLPGGKREVRHVHAIDWSNPEANDFLVVNQLRVQGPRQNERRPDMIVYVNGLPLALFELKNPYHESPTTDDAINQIAHYRNEIPQVFDYNAVTVVSDGVNTLHGMWTSRPEWFAAWKSIDGRSIEPATTASTKMLLEGLFAKDRLLAYIHDFILFEVNNDTIVKKGARYHQYFAVRIAAERAIKAMTAEGDRRVGVIWHTTGSGKSLSMVFLIGILRRDPALKNPTFVVQVDRNDLDDQLHNQFVLARSLVGDVKHADTVDGLRDLLRTEGGEVIFTTIEKFRLKEGEIEHEVLSARSNILVIADEAHRSQYGFTEGYARYLAEALPNARRLGFTGTPVSLTGADTVEVFGNVIHTYDIRQSQEDKATVPIYYAPRQVKLHLSKRDVDAALAEVGAGRDPTDLERAKTRWAALAAAAGAKDRLAELAQDLLAHFHDRTKTLDGKALIVCMTRANCVRMFDALKAIPGCPEVKIVMTGNLGEDDPAWSAAGHLTTKNARDLIKKRMVDDADPLKLVIVCDMWLTGTDIPCLHTLYVDKPMRGHNMIQAISRVNRVFRDKPHGLIVDYIGIGDDLREATARYTAEGSGEPAPDVEATARPLFEACLAEVRTTLPEGKAYGGWRRMGGIELEDLYALVYGTFAEDSERREAFLKAETRLSE
ncbi:MAG: type I restriction endonuclease subunit R, partial [Myxococcota bacterium]|nr:type I restriction endonuclease subunit R [Myxococcota bacterium]